MFFDNEKKIKEENEKTIREMEKEMALTGCNEFDSTFFYTTEYERLVSTFIKSRKVRIYDFELPSRTTKFIRENANKALIMQTGDIDRTVLYLEDNKRIVYDFEGTYQTKLDKSNIDEFIKFIRKNAIKKDVTKLPISWKTSKERDGAIRSLSIYPDDISVIKKYPIISTGITLTNQQDDLGSVVLVHEMTHALVDRYKGNIRNILHIELLSIYMELVAAYELDSTHQLARIAILSRLQNLKNNIITAYKDTYNGYMPKMTYIDSTLYAFSLFEKYRNGSDKIREMIRKEINEIFLGNQVLEDVLEKFGVTQKEGSQIIQGYVKKLMK